MHYCMTVKIYFAHFDTSKKWKSSIIFFNIMRVEGKKGLNNIMRVESEKGLNNILRHNWSMNRNFVCVHYQLAPHRLWVQIPPGTWILSCEEAMQIAYRIVPEIMHGREPVIFLLSKSCHITFPVLVLRYSVISFYKNYFLVNWITDFLLVTYSNVSWAFWFDFIPVNNELQLFVNEAMK